MLAEIIAIGDELLIGQVIDTNSNYIAAQLTANGINVQHINAVSDEKTRILIALETALGRADLVILTGGLGPTNDDITKKTLAEYFNTNLILHEEMLIQVKTFISGRGIPFSEKHQLQAVLPENCIALKNSTGTAPGMWFEKEGKIVVSLPGVPLEMKSLMQEEVLPRIAKINTNRIYNLTISTIGYTESALAELIAPWETKLPSDVKLAYLPAPGQVRLRISRQGENMDQMQSASELLYANLRNYLPESAIYSLSDNSIQKTVHQLLTQKGLSFATAESCTGGYIAHLLTSLPGSSVYFSGSVVAYSNQIKANILNVSEETLSTYGAVSKETVTEMAQNIRALFKVEIAVAVSGIAGPDGGTLDKPVGTVHIAVAYRNGIIAQQFQFGKIRERNIISAATSALNMVRLCILANY
ncbi:MAG TPA: competence/damage-inducible protein A [Bacteroidales bacterium]|nr:competence/damage-inducible protein A [Bacteroidales bacterium]